MKTVSIFDMEYVNEDKSVEISQNNKEPAWYTSRRKVALENYHSLPFDKDTLFYKYTNFRKFDPQELTPNYELESRSIEPITIENLNITSQDDGKNIKINLSQDLIEKGVFFGTLKDFISLDENKAKTIIEKINPYSVGFDKLGSLAIALAENPLIFYVPKGITISKPIVKVTKLASSGVASFTDFIAYFERDTKLTLVELFLKSDNNEKSNLYNSMNTYYLEENSQIHAFTLQNWSEKTVHIYSRNVVLSNYSKMISLTHIQGSDMVRQNNLINMVGNGSEGYDLYVELGSKKQRFDVKSELKHLTKDTIGQTHARTVMMDNSESILRGLITITEKALNADSWLTSKGLTVGKAKITAIPSLAILQNEVKAAHAASVEPLNEDTMFYLQTRGVDATTAREMLVKGYFEYVLKQFKNEELTDISRSFLNTKWQEVS